MTYYATLGVKETATNTELKSAYRKLVKKYHPDISKAPDAKEQIRKINIAYETLADPYTRQVYDSQLGGVILEEVVEESPAEKYKREYLRKRAQQERERIEYLIKLKVKFYRAERMVCYFFLLIGVLFTIDYHFHDKERKYMAESIEPSRFATEVNLSHVRFMTEIGLLRDHHRTGQLQISIIYSSIFEIPTQVKLENEASSYKIFGTLHSYNNVFSVIIMVLSLVVISNKEFTDFRLTCGIIPALLVIFILLFAATHPTF